VNADPSETYRIIFAKDFANDLERIFRYIAEDSPANAAQFIGQILAAVEGLSEFPLRHVVQGQDRRGLPLRSMPVGNYVIYFRADVAKHIVRVVRVIHGAKRQPKRFK
jgi:plasmid stabilization system protein ParE